MRKCACIIFVFSLSLLLFSCASQKTSGDTAHASVPSETYAENDSSAAAPKEPVLLASLPSDIHIKPLNETSLFPLLELSEEFKIPDLYAVALRESDPVNLTSQAENAAKELWGTYTIENNGNYILFLSEITDTPDGDFCEQIHIDKDGSLSYQAKWLDAEETPFQHAENPDRDAAILLARELASAFGLEEMTSAEPVVESGKSNADFRISWCCDAYGLPVDPSDSGLVIRIIGDTAVTLRLNVMNLVPAENETAPTYFLQPEEAVYCMNYSRGLAGEESVFFLVPELQSIRLVWTSLFASPDYTPAYAFTFTNEIGSLTYTFYVDAYTGKVNTDTNEGCHPSPYYF